MALVAKDLPANAGAIRLRGRHDWSDLAHAQTEGTRTSISSAYVTITHPPADSPLLTQTNIFGSPESKENYFSLLCSFFFHSFLPYVYEDHLLASSLCRCLWCNERMRVCRRFCHTVYVMRIFFHFSSVLRDISISQECFVELALACWLFSPGGCGFGIGVTLRGSTVLVTERGCNAYIFPSN